MILNLNLDSLAWHIVLVAIALMTWHRILWGPESAPGEKKENAPPKIIAPVWRHTDDPETL